MRERLTSGIAVALLLALVVGTWWAADYAQRAIPVDPPRKLTHEIDTFIDRFVMMRIDESGLPIERLEGPHALHYPDDDSYEVYQPRAVSQQADRSVTIATAQQGRMDQDGERIELTGNVRLQREPADDAPALTIETEALTLRPQEDVAFTDLPATITRADGSRMTGTGMHYDNRTRQLTVSADTRVKIMPRSQSELLPSRRNSSNP